MVYSLSASAELLMGSGNAGLRGGSTSMEGGRAPGAARGWRGGALLGLLGEDRTGVAALYARRRRRG